MKNFLNILLAAEACLAAALPTPPDGPISTTTLRSNVGVVGDLDGPIIMSPKFDKRRNIFGKLGHAVDHVVSEAGKLGKDAATAVSEAIQGTAKTIEITAEDIGDAFSDSLKDPSAILNIFKSAACDQVAAAGLPVYLAAAADFAAMNSGGIPTTPDQNYFINALDGNIFEEGISIFYKAKFAPGFNDVADGVTMGKNIYLAPENAPQGSDPDFVRIIKLLVHEMVHAKQYRSFGWNLSEFGRRYIFNYCSAGFSPSKNEFEKEARAPDGPVDQLLTGIGWRFFDIWRTHGLQSSLGYPSQPAYSTIPGASQVKELEFQHGIMQLNTGGCFKILSQAEINARAASKCTFISCSTSTGPHSPIIERGAFCSESLRDRNEACRIARLSWNSMLAQGFDCNA